MKELLQNDTFSHMMCLGLLPYYLPRNVTGPRGVEGGVSEGHDIKHVSFPSVRTDRLQWKGLEIGFAGPRQAKATLQMIAAANLSPFPTGWLLKHVKA